jgi:uncharacterized protein
MIIDPEKLVIDMRSLSRGMNSGSFIIPLDRINWDIEGVEPADDEATLDLFIDYEDSVVLCNGRLNADFRAPCARCLEPVRFNICEDISREYTWELDPSAEEEREIVSQSGEICLLDAVREAILLSIPGKPLCSPDCDGIYYN